MNACVTYHETAFKLPLKIFPFNNISFSYQYFIICFYAEFGTNYGSTFMPLFLNFCLLRYFYRQIWNSQLSISITVNVNSKLLAAITSLSFPKTLWLRPSYLCCRPFFIRNQLLDLHLNLYIQPNVSFPEVLNIFRWRLNSYNLQ